jgi:hypothetical protein
MCLIQIEIYFILCHLKIVQLCGHWILELYAVFSLYPNNCLKIDVSVKAVSYVQFVLFLSPDILCKFKLRFGT